MASFFKSNNNIKILSYYLTELLGPENLKLRRVCYSGLATPPVAVVRTIKLF